MTSWEWELGSFASSGVDLSWGCELQEAMDRHGPDASGLTDPLRSLACWGGESDTIAMMPQSLCHLLDDGCLTSPRWASHARELA
jgi:hypothetical protein